MLETRPTIEGGVHSEEGTGATVFSFGAENGHAWWGGVLFRGGHVDVHGLNSDPSRTCKAVPYEAGGAGE